MLLYLKALHIIFIVTWFSGMFYIVRLFIYNTEAEERIEAERNVLRQQFTIMIKRLWFGITWPSAILTLIFGPWVMYTFGYFNEVPAWLWVKIAFVLGLYAYHFSLHAIFRQQMNGIFKYSSQRLRIWNEVATIFGSYCNAGGSKAKHELGVGTSGPYFVCDTFNECNKGV